MTVYQTCRNCAFANVTCGRRAIVRAGIKGMGLTSIKFRCDTRQAMYKRGQRVSVTWRYYSHDGDRGGDVSLETWPATVVSETIKGFLVAVDDVDSDNDLPAREFIKIDSLYCNVTAGKLTPLDEPFQPSCEYCSSVMNPDGTVTGCWGVDGYDGIRRVDNCLVRTLAAQITPVGAR